MYRILFMFYIEFENWYYSHRHIHLCRHFRAYYQGLMFQASQVAGEILWER